MELSRALPPTPPYARSTSKGMVAAAALFVTLLAGAQLGLGIRISDLMRDPSAIAGQPFYIGLGSHVGVLLWCATAAVCIFGAAVLAKQGRDRALRSFLQVSGIFTLILALDDFFLLHEQMLPRHLGIPEMVVLASYGMFAVGYLIAFGRIIARTDHSMLRLALILFTLSLVLDVLPVLVFDSSATIDDVPAPLLDVHLLFEDGAKLIGIVSWLAYFTGLCQVAIRSTTRAAKIEADGRSA